MRLSSFPCAGSTVRRRRATLAASALLVLPATAATYHVATDGRDDGPGTSARPFATVQHAADIVQPGDTVHVHAGIYPEDVTIKNSGTAERPIVFEGERSADGNWATIVDRSRLVTDWAPAPEIGAGVFKAKLHPAPASMTLEDRQLVRISDKLMSTEAGTHLLRLPAENQAGEGYPQHPMNFWDGVEAVYGSRDGVTYVRFRRGGDPSRLALKAAPAGGGFTLANRSHVVIRRFVVRGAQDAVTIDGREANYNVIEENLLQNGRNRVVIHGGGHNVIRNNEMTLNYYGYEDLGAWGGNVPTARTDCRYHVYQVFKFTAGANASDDRGVYIRGAGAGNEVAGNHIYGGLIGVSCACARNPRVHHNRIHNMSSIGILTSEGVVDGEFHDNTIADCNIALRIHHYNTPADNDRREYHYRNRISLPEGVGTGIFVHWLSEEWPRGTRHPEIWIYHNSIAGGRYAFSPGSAKGGGLQRTRLVNNLFSSPTVSSATAAFLTDASLLGAFDYNGVAGALSREAPAWSGAHNLRLRTGRFWPVEREPDFVLPADSPARSRGLDLSAPFLLAGTLHPPLPGMVAGYFKGVAPDLGAPYLSVPQAP